MRAERLSFRRGIAGGVALGAAAGVVLAIFEVTFVARSAWGYFEGVRELVRFALGALGVLAAGGAIAGAVEGTLAAALVRAADALASRSDRRDVWVARFVTALGTAPVALACAQIFRGPQAQKIPGHDLYAVAIGLAALGGLWLVTRRWLALASALEDGRVRASVAVGLGAIAIAAAWGAYVADQRVLPRLYPFFHHGLAVLAFAAVQIGLAIVFLRLGPRRGLGPRTALWISLLALAGGASALRGFDRARGLRSLALERTSHLARLLRVAPSTRAANAAAPDASAASTGAAAAPLPDGPRLGDTDVYLITVDAMRADRLQPRTAPFMSGLAASGTRFERAYAQVPHTSFSIATLLTGKHVYSLAALGLDAAEHETIAAVLRRERYKTAAFYPPSVFYIDHDRLKALEDSRYGFEYVKYEYLPAAARTQQVIDFLEHEHPARAFVWVHYLEPHEPYEPHPGYTTAASSLMERYDGEVELVDAEVARLVGWVRAHRPRALVVLAADHGEEFGEHGGQYHGTTLYEEQVRVPLAFAALDRAIPARVVGGPVGLVDVAPTLLSLLGIPPSARMRGRDLGPWLSRAGAPDAALGPELGEIDRKKMIVDGHDKLICDLENDACQRYDLAADPGERRNLVDEGPRAQELRGKLDAWMAAETRFERAGAAAVVPVDETTRRALERGRLGDRAAAPDLAALLGSRAGEVSDASRAEAARLLARLPADPSLEAALETATSDRSPAAARWAQVALARLGDAAAHTQVGAWLATTCAAAFAARDGDAAASGASGPTSPSGASRPASPSGASRPASPSGASRPALPSDAGGPGGIELCARGALAVGDVVEEGRALEHLVDDLELDVQLTRALGASHDERALDPLIVHLGAVRSRAETAQALGELGDPRALDTLDRWIAAEPYLPVRAALARTIARLALDPRSGARRADAERALVALAEHEPEPPVMRAIIESLGALGSPAAAAAAHARVPSAGELWLTGDGDGPVELTIGGARAEPAELKDGVARLGATRGGMVALRPGPPTVRWIYWRKALVRR